MKTNLLLVRIPMLRRESTSRVVRTIPLNLMGNIGTDDNAFSFFLMVRGTSVVGSSSIVNKGVLTATIMAMALPLTHSRCCGISAIPIIL